MPSPDVRIYQIKVTLMDSIPPIWRRLQVRSGVTLRKMHNILQAAMGWQNSHLHMFRGPGGDYGRPDPEAELDWHDDRTFTLARILIREQDPIVYTYDMGDGWEHELLLEKVLDPEPGVRYPRCLDGARACPPEDCGGMSGYENVLAALKDPNHPEHEDMKVWLEGWVPSPFDPEAFVLPTINAELRKVR